MGYPKLTNNDAVLDTHWQLTWSLLTKQTSGLLRVKSLLTGYVSYDCVTSGARFSSKWHVMNSTRQAKHSSLCQKCPGSEWDTMPGSVPYVITTKEVKNDCSWIWCFFFSPYTRFRPTWASLCKYTVKQYKHTRYFVVFFFVFLCK